MKTGWFSVAVECVVLTSKVWLFIWPFWTVIRVEFPCGWLAGLQAVSNVNTAMNGLTVAAVLLFLGVSL